jgi:hypothetical protein
MSEKPGEHLEEEPQSERGPVGSRDAGSDEPGGGPVDRPAGQADDSTGRSVDAQDPIDDEMPEMPTGDQGG